MLNQRFAITTFYSHEILRIHKIATIHFMLNGLALLIFMTTDQPEQVT